jgi:hypothetical protein
VLVGFSAAVGALQFGEGWVGYDILTGEELDWEERLDRMIGGGSAAVGFATTTAIGMAKIPYINARMTMPPPG